MDDSFEISIDQAPEIHKKATPNIFVYNGGKAVCFATKR